MPDSGLDVDALRIPGIRSTFGTGIRARQVASSEIIENIDLIISMLSIGLTPSWTATRAPSGTFSRAALTE